MPDLDQPTYGRVRADLPVPDLRLVLPACAAWAGAWWAFSGPGWLGPLVMTAGVAVVARLRSNAGWAVLLALLACATSGALHGRSVAGTVVAEAAGSGAYAQVDLRTTGDVRVRPGRFGEVVILRATVTHLTWRGDVRRTRAPVLVVASGEDAAAWKRVELASRVRVTSRLSDSDTPDLSAVLYVSRPPTLLAEPPGLLGGAEAVRAALREAVVDAGPEARALVPALVVGDDAGLPPDVVEEFQVSGLTHLTAVSGTNLTLVVGFLLIVARWSGVRGRAQIVIGLLGVAGFVVLARDEPSVVRAATMGSIALLGMGASGRTRGVRTLGVAVLVLLVLDPWLARSPGFALSVLATAGILFLAPPVRDALMQWLPRWVAEAVAVPTAAQVACTPVVAWLSGQVSLVAVVANLLAAPAVGPATVLGLLAGLVHLLWELPARFVGRLAGWCADWIVLVADRGAALPVAAVTWPTGPWGLAGLTVACLAVAAVTPGLVANRARALTLCVVLVVLMVRPVGVPAWVTGWPPPGWLLVGCDVGQGDALVLRAGDGRGVVVDAGPDPRLVDGCLRRLGVRSVPLVVITHFHADHVAGLAGVLRGRDVGEVWVTGLRDPAPAAAEVDRVAAAARVTVRIPAYAETVQVGGLTLQVVGPAGRVAGSGSAANDASLVLLAQARGHRVLLTGDVEPAGQRALARRLGGLRVDVLKVPHHGSRHQDTPWLAGLGARVAVVSAGADNDYGHPAPETLALFADAGAAVLRTDLEGDVAVVVTDGVLTVAGSR